MDSTKSSFNRPPLKLLLLQYLRSKGRAPFPFDGHFREANNITFLNANEETQKIILRDIQNASTSISIHTYILGNDSVGQTFLNLLLKQAQRGIKVSLLTDAVGTQIPQEWKAYLQKGAIQWVSFNPVLSDQSYTQNLRRAHQKIILIDDKILYVGGFNLAQEYFSPYPINPVPWVDFCLRIESKKLEFISKYLRQIEEFSPTTECFAVEGNLNQDEINNRYRFLMQDGLHGLHHVSDQVNKALKSAQEEILIFGGYFFPSPLLLNKLVKAKKRGVVVRILMSEHSDVPWQLYASFYIAQKLSKKGIEIGILKNRVLHGKALVTDDKWCCLGSYNFHFTSNLINLEMNIETIDPQVVSNLKKHFMDLFNNQSELWHDYQSGHFLNHLYWRCRNYLAYRITLIFQLIYQHHFKRTDQ